VAVATNKKNTVINTCGSVKIVWS